MPIFGYDTIGATSQAGGYYNYGCLFNCSENGTLQSISIALSPQATTDKLKVAIYDSSFNLLSSGELNPVGSMTKQFYTVSVTPISLVAGSDYYLAAGAADLNGDVQGTILIWRDAGNTWVVSNMTTDTNYAGLWENPWTPNANGGADRKFSYYATYETSTSSSTTSTSSSTTSTSSSTTSTSSSTTSTSSSTTNTTSTSTSTTVPYLKFIVELHK